MCVWVCVWVGVCVCVLGRGGGVEKAASYMKAVPQGKMFASRKLCVRRRLHEGVVNNAVRRGGGGGPN